MSLPTSPKSGPSSQGPGGARDCMIEINTAEMYNRTRIIVNNCQDITEKDLKFKQQQLLQQSILQ